MKHVRTTFILIFLVIFCTESFGIYKHAHFCGGEKTSESFYLLRSNCCCADVPEDKDHCCNNVTQVVQFNEKTSLTIPPKVPGIEKTALKLFYIEDKGLHNFSKAIESKSHFSIFPPVLYPKPPLLDKLCIFRI